MCLVSQSDEEYKDILKNARRKLETPMAAAMPCKRAFSQASIREPFATNTEKAKTAEAKTSFSCIAEAHESTRQRSESVTLRARGVQDALKSGTGKKGVQTPDIILFSQPRETVSSVWFRKFWRSLRNASLWKP